MSGRFLKPVFIVSVLLCFICTTSGQGIALKGIVRDSTEKADLANAVITVLRAKDSILLKFTRVRSDGSYDIGDLSPCRVLVIASYPGYADYVNELTLVAGQAERMDTVYMITKVKLLEAVIVKNRVSAIRVKGDTTEYKADSFYVPPNATVEDLLKRLPGIQVNKNGQIMAQGEVVRKVLVDGEEFFGDDPTMVTQNLRADMIDKVQLYDKKSDKAAFTGIDDGGRSKAINLVLKEDKKNGDFGKAAAGIGNGSYFDNSAMYNKFKGKKKFAVFGILSNTGKMGLNNEEQTDYVSDINIGYGSSANNLTDIWDGNYNGNGFPLVQSGGMHYSNKWNEDKQSVNSDYKISQLQVNGDNSTATDYTLPDTSYFTNEKNHFNDKIFRNRIKGGFECQLDSSSSIKITTEDATDHKNVDNTSSSESLTKNNWLINQGGRHITGEGEKNVFNNTVFFRKRLNSDRRILSVQIGENYKDDNSSGYLKSDNYFYVPGNLSPVLSQTIDQYKTGVYKELGFNSEITCTQPVSENAFLVGNYGMAVNNSSSDRNSYGKSQYGKYDLQDSAYSNDYSFNIVTQKGGLGYTLVKEKYYLISGMDMSYSRFEQKDHWADTAAKKEYFNWLPHALFSYAFTRQRRLFLSYNGFSTQPTLGQIQPLPVNNDPLNIALGNPALRPSFSSNMGLQFSDYRMINQRTLSVRMNYRTTQNAMSTREFVDTLGRRVYQTVNLKDNYLLSLHTGYDFNWKNPNVDVEISGDLTENGYWNIINNIENSVKRNEYRLGCSFNKTQEKKYDISLNASVDFTNSSSSVYKSGNMNYWVCELQPDMNVFLTDKWQIHTDCGFFFRQKDEFLYGNGNIILWNAWLGRRLLKANNLLLKIAVNDILNNNTGLGRTISDTYISQNTYSTIKRYAMLTVAWNFIRNR